MRREYSTTLTAVVNEKGVVDVDVVKGCTDGMKAYPGGGCYGSCYALKSARMRGLVFEKSIVRQVTRRSQLNEIVRAAKKSKLPFIRIGTMGDPSFDWGVTMSHAKLFAESGLWVVIITKHWRRISEERLLDLGPRIIFNTSVSALDTRGERDHRVTEFERIKPYARSILRVVTCNFNRENEKGREFAAIQDRLLARGSTIDTPLRVPASYPLVKAGIISVRKVGRQMVSLHDEKVYLGKCGDCPDLCGVGL